MFGRYKKHSMPVTRYLIRSRDRTADSASSNNFTLGQNSPFFTRVRSVELESAIIPLSQPTVVSSYNSRIQINTTFGGVPEGFYSASELCAAIQTLFSAIAGFACTYDAVTKRVTLRATSAFTVTWTDQPLGYMLGFRPTSVLSGATSYTSPFTVDMTNSETYILINVSSPGFNARRSLQTSGNLNASFLVPNSLADGSLLEYTKFSGFEQRVEFSDSVSFGGDQLPLSISLSNVDGSAFDMRSREWSFVMSIEYDN